MLWQFERILVLGACYFVALTFCIQGVLRPVREGFKNNGGRFRGCRLGNDHRSCNKA